MTVNVVIGAASGIGEATARKLASRANPLVLADMNLEKVAQVAAELAGAAAVHCDLTRHESISRLAELCGDVAILVLTGGIAVSRLLASDARGQRDRGRNGRGHLLNPHGPRLSRCADGICSRAIQPANSAIDDVLNEPLAPGFIEDLAKVGAEVDDPAAMYGLSKRGVLLLVPAVVSILRSQRCPVAVSLAGDRRHTHGSP